MFRKLVSLSLMSARMELQEARKVLSEINKWRRSQGEYAEKGTPMPYSARAFGVALDIAVTVLDKQLEHENGRNECQNKQSD